MPKPTPAAAAVLNRAVSASQIFNRFLNIAAVFGSDFADGGLFRRLTSLFAQHLVISFAARRFAAVYLPPCVGVLVAFVPIAHCVSAFLPFSDGLIQNLYPIAASSSSVGS